MAGIREYINQFGDRTFEEYPFNDSDALTLSEIIYMPFEKVVSFVHNLLMPVKMLTSK